MQKIKGKIFIFIASIITGIIIAINVGILENNEIFELDSMEYKDAIEIRNTLYRDIENLKKENSSIDRKMALYDFHDYDHEKVILDMKNQLKDYSVISGASSVKGSGIILSINDGDYNINEDTDYEVNRRTLHDIDLAMVLNELRYIGAEAIAVNDYRILNDTGVECDWAFIIFNKIEASRQAQPFNFYAIGNSEELESALFSEGSYLNKLITRGLKVDITKVQDLELIPASENLDIKYMERLN